VTARFVLTGLRKQYDGARALDWSDTDRIEVSPGVILGLAGENGAGKSTLLGAVSGSVPLDAGDLTLDGEAYRPSGPFDALAKGVALIPQETLLSPTLTVAENVLLGREKEYTSFGLIRGRRRDALAREALAALGLDLDLRAEVGGLALEYRKLIELARALAARPRVLLVDETSNVLSRDGAIRLFEEMHGFAARGGSVLFVTHRLDEIVQHCDRVAVLKDGRLVSEMPVAETDERSISSAMVGRELVDQLTRPTGSAEAAGREPVLEVVDLQADGCAALSFTVHAGEVLGIGGLVGCGADAVVRGITGCNPSRAASVRLHGRELRGLGLRGRLAAGIAYVPKDRDEEGLLLGDSVQDNIVLGSLDRLSRFGWVSPRAGRGDVARLMTALSIKARGPGMQVVQLSGGNRQKVLLARWLQREVPVLVLNNPTRGVDVGAKGDIYRLLDQARAQGKALVVVSDELPELVRLADRVLIMRQGAVSAEYASPLPSEQDMIGAML